jgi:signal transduction histidine kinase
MLVLFFQRRNKRKLDRTRINSLLVAIAILWVFGGNDLLPIFGLNFYPGTQIHFYPLGNVAAVLYVMVVAYSVLQHQLLDIHVTLGRLAAHLVRFAFLSLVGLTLLSILAVLRPRDFTIVSWMGGVGVVLISGIVASVFFPRMFGDGGERLERKILGDRFEYHDRVRGFIDSLHAYSDTNVLLADLDELLDHTVGVGSYKIILLDETSRVFSLFRSHPEEEQRQIPELHAKSPVFQLFEKSKVEYLSCGTNDTSSIANDIEWNARKQLAKFAAEYCFPFFFEEQPFGLLLLGAKVNGEPFTATDIHLLSKLCKNLTLVINQIRLREQVMRAHELELLGRMSRGLAHDLNNLLTPVWTMAELAGSGVPMEDLTEDILPVAIRNLKTMRAYIREALFFSENLRPDFQLGRLDVLVKQAVEMVEAKRAAKQIKISINAPSDALVEMDEVLLQRLIGNILSNAIDASPAASAIRVDVSRLIQTDALRDWFRVRVIDEGEGIPSEHLRRISTPYFTTKNRGDETRGFGLGLAISRKIVHLHGGHMNIFSQVRRGTTVQVDVPSRQLKPAEPATPSLKQ